MAQREGKGKVKIQIKYVYLASFVYACFKEDQFSLLAQKKPFQNKTSFVKIISHFGNPRGLLPSVLGLLYIYHRWSDESMIRTLYAERAPITRDDNFVLERSHFRQHANKEWKPGKWSRWWPRTSSPSTSPPSSSVASTSRWPGAGRKLELGRDC